MSKRIAVDLITGFLGAGKTTFIRGYVRYLKEQGISVRIIENEYGDVGIDSELLKEEECDIQDLSGLCMCCVGKTEFINMLQSSAALGCDRILVEPSGIYDVDEFFEVMSLPRIHGVCEIGSIITIADPYGTETLSEEAKYLAFAQLLSSGIVLVSKTTGLKEEEIGQGLSGLHEIMKERGCEIGIPAQICTKPWESLTDDDYEEIMDAGYARFVHDRELFSHAEVFQSVSVKGDFEGKEDLTEKIRKIFCAEDCGRVYRVKGFALDLNGNGYEVNCTREIYTIKKCDMKKQSLAVIGQNVRIKGLKAQGLQCELA